MLDVGLVSNTGECLMSYLILRRRNGPSKNPESVPVDVILRGSLQEDLKKQRVQVRAPKAVEEHSRHVEQVRPAEFPAAYVF